MRNVALRDATRDATLATPGQPVRDRSPPSTHPRPRPGRSCWPACCSARFFKQLHSPPRPACICAAPLCHAPRRTQPTPVCPTRARHLPPDDDARPRLHLLPCHGCLTAQSHCQRLHAPPRRQWAQQRHGPCLSPDHAAPRLPGAAPPHAGHARPIPHACCADRTAPAFPAARPCYPANCYCPQRSAGCCARCSHRGHVHPGDQRSHWTRAPPERARCHLWPHRVCPRHRPGPGLPGARPPSWPWMPPRLAPSSASRRDRMERRRRPPMPPSRDQHASIPPALCIMRRAPSRRCPGHCACHAAPSDP